jgi:hypothetical protein
MTIGRQIGYRYPFQRCLFQISKGLSSILIEFPSCPLLFQAINRPKPPLSKTLPNTNIFHSRNCKQLQRHRWSPQFTNHHSTRQAFPACCVFTSRSLATASNIGYPSASCTQFLSSPIPVQISTELCPFIITSRHRPHRKHSISIVVVQLLHY